MIRMCIDPGRYEPDEYWRSIGIATLEQARHEMLWRAAAEGARPEHTVECADCFALWESFLRLRAIAVPEDQGGEVAVAMCPAAPVLAAYQSGEMEDERAEAIRAHLKTCPPCREDLAFLARSAKPRERLLSLRTRTILMAVAAAALIAAVIPWQRGGGDSTEVKLNFTPSSRWANLAHMPTVNRAELLEESPEEHHSRLEQVIDAYEKGDYATAEKYAAIMTGVVTDSSAEYMLAMARYKQKKLMEGYKAMLVAERIEPKSVARCWATLNYALLVGDKKTVEREAGHAGSQEEYDSRCRDILSKIT